VHCHSLVNLKLGEADMISFVPVREGFTLDDYAAIAQLAGAVRELEAEASTFVGRLRDRTIWMVNSTARGGGVAEMLPKMVSLLQELGLKAQWVTIGTDRPRFFALTKRIHNLIHGEGDPALAAADRELYEAVNRENARELAAHMAPEDIVVIHDPQPMCAASCLKEQLPVRTIWRCHIGYDRRTSATRAAWNFLRPYADAYDQAVFSAPEYIPDYFAGRATIIHPAVDPQSHKNRDLDPHKLVGVLCDAGLMTARHPILTPPFEHRAQRLGSDGALAPAADGEEIGLLYRPIVTQVSRWDRLKGFDTLLDAFVKLKERLRDSANGWDARQQRRIEILRLVLAGPDPASIQDDPEGVEVLRELCDKYRRLPQTYKQDIALLTLPMQSRKENALMVTALQRCSTVIVQNSRREGFGLTATEAMWKRVPILATRACGLRQQIREQIDGILVQDPDNPAEICNRIENLLGDVPKRDKLALNAERRVHREFLVFNQLCDWLRLFASVARHG
jgi:trehalose synthase